MKYIVELNGERREVDVNGPTVALNGREVAVRLDVVEGTPIRLVTIDDEVHRIVVRRLGGRGRYVLSVKGYRFEVEALDERSRTIRDITGASAKHSGTPPIVAPMPGLVVRVNVAVGDVIPAGHAAVVMEAMKMENELRSLVGGRVKAVHAEAGSAAEKGEILVELE